MAVFVDLDDDDVDLPQHHPHIVKPVWAPLPSEPSTTNTTTNSHAQNAQEQYPLSSDRPQCNEADHDSAVQESPNSMAVALGCYP